MKGRGRHRMFKNIAKILCIGSAFLVFDGFVSKVGAPIAPGATTPTRLDITLNSVGATPNLSVPYTTFLNVPATIDIVNQTGQIGSAFGSGVLRNTIYRAILMNMEGVGVYDGVDPCTGIAVTSGAVQLPESVDGKVVIQYQTPDADVALPPDVKLIPPLTVSGSPVEFRLVFPVSDSIICASSAAPLRSITGQTTGLILPKALDLDAVNQEIVVANTNDAITIFARTDTGDISPIRSIRGSFTGLNKPSGIFIDPINDEYIVANNGNNSIAVFSRQDEGNISPKRLIQGSSTGLADPEKIVVDTVNNEIIVANTAGSSLTFYNRTDSGNVEPLRILSGLNTQLSSPVGLYLDMANDEIVVTNSGNNSVTVYHRADSGDVPPVRTLIGNRTGLDNPAAAAVDPDPASDELLIANSGSDTVTLYNRSSNGNVSPLRTIRGKPTMLDEPAGLYVDASNSEIIVVSSENASVTVHSRANRSVQLDRLPTLIIDVLQQRLFVHYFYTGFLDKTLGTRRIDPATQQPAPINFEGYQYIWQITDDRIRQNGDASDATLIPPTDTVFKLADGRLSSNLVLECSQFTAFIRIRLSTNCPPVPLIISPYPAAGGEYTIPASLLGQVTINKMDLPATPAQPSMFPQPIPTVTRSPNGGIERIDWTYADDGTRPLMIFSQQILILLTRSYSEVSNCYQQVQGQNTNLVFSTGVLTPDIRNASEIKNNRCEIFIDDVQAIRFIVTDALNNDFIYDWRPI